MNIQEQKARLRYLMRMRLRRQTTVDPALNLLRFLRNFAPYRNATSVLLYASTSYEVFTDEVIEFCLKDNKITALPKVRKKQGAKDSAAMDFFILSPNLSLQEQIQPGAFGIREPCDFCPLFNPEKAVFPLLMCMPALAFSENGSRLGHGGGYYDRYCTRLNTCIRSIHVCPPSSQKKNIVYVGFCRDIQIIGKIPSEAHDIRADYLISETGIRATKPL